MAFLHAPWHSVYSRLKDQVLSATTVCNVGQQTTKPEHSPTDLTQSNNLAQIITGMPEQHNKFTINHFVYLNSTIVQS